MPAMFTLVAWSHCYNTANGDLTPWNPVNAAELSIPGRGTEAQNLKKL